jgi:hypothetical protein
MTTRADRRGWGPGWPTGVPPSKLRTVKAKLSGTTLMVRDEIAPLVKFCLDEIEARGYLYDHGPSDPLDDWSYVNRPIAGTSIPSNHSWGLAFDLDATLYPQGQRKRRPPQWVDDLWQKYGFSNGWTFPNPDPMHYEFLGTVADARFLVASLAAHSIQNTEPPMPPSAPLPRRDEDVKVYKLIYPNRVEYWLGRSSGLATNLAPQDIAPLTSIYGTVVEIVGEVNCSAFKNFNDELPFEAIRHLSEGAMT